MSVNPEIKIISYGSPEYEEEVALRDAVLRKPLGLHFTEEQLAAEKDEVHIAAYLDNVLIGCLLLKKLSGDELKMRQVAVVDSLQQSGIGKALVHFAEEYAQAKGFSRISMHARDTAVPFYLKLGYSIEGEQFLEVTIPHHTLIKNLRG